jgi:hypothetical protein
MGEGRAVPPAPDWTPPLGIGFGVALDREVGLGEEGAASTTSVPLIPMETWNRQMNGYLPGGRLMVTSCACPGLFTMSIPWPETVNV